MLDLNSIINLHYLTPHTQRNIHRYFVSAAAVLLAVRMPVWRRLSEKSFVLGVKIATINAKLEKEGSAPVGNDALP